MPRGFDSARDPNRRGDREGVMRRIVSRYTDPEPAEPAPVVHGPVQGPVKPFLPGVAAGEYPSVDKRRAKAEQAFRQRGYRYD